MPPKPTYEELAAQVAQLEHRVSSCSPAVSGCARPEHRDQEAFLTSIIRVAPTGIGVVQERVFVKVNDRFCQMTGYSSDELVGSHSRMVYETDEEFERAGREKYHQINDKGTGSVETRFLCKDGSVIDVLLSSTPIDLADLGKGVTFTALDITRRKKAEAELVKSEFHYRSMMESMTDLVYICSPDYRVEYMNPAMIERIGRDASGDICYRAIHNLSEKCSWCRRSLIEARQHYELDIVSPNDNRSYHVVNSPMVNDQGQVSKLTVFRDVTDQKKMEERLVQTRKIEALGTLAGGIAHDFNNILSPIIGLTELMIEDAKEGSYQENYLNQILKAGLRARDLVKQILSFSRQNNTGVEVINIQPLVKEIIKLASATLPSTIRIFQDIAGDTGLVKAGSTQIHQIVMNLMTNAFHAMEKEGGTLTFRLANKEHDREFLQDGVRIPSGSYVCLSVIDTGTGMDSLTRQKLFEPYFTTKDPDKGTGLGLSVVYDSVKALGGYIVVESEPGQGAAFHVYFPSVQGNPEQEPASGRKHVETNQEGVLVVDDEEVIRDMLKMILEREGYRVAACSDPSEALEIVAESPDKFDVVVTDLTMPGMTGDKLSLKLREIKPDLPIILCTGYSEEIDDSIAEKLGINTILMKPVSRQDLLSAIAECVQ